jgi:hypothetical protein
MGSAQPSGFKAVARSGTGAPLLCFSAPASLTCARDGNLAAILHIQPVTARRIRFLPVKFLGSRFAAAHCLRKIKAHTDANR